MWGRICKKEKKEKEKNHHLCPCFETTSKSGVVSCDSGCYGCISAGGKQEENGKNNLLAIQGSGPCLPFRHFSPLFSSYFICSNHHGLLTTPWTQSAISTLRVLVPKVSSFQETILPVIYVAFHLTLFSFIFKYHLISCVFPDQLSNLKHLSFYLPACFFQQYLA